MKRSRKQSRWQLTSTFALFASTIEITCSAHKKSLRQNHKKKFNNILRLFALCNVMTATWLLLLLLRRKGALNRNSWRFPFFPLSWLRLAKTETKKKKKKLAVVFNDKQFPHSPLASGLIYDISRCKLGGGWRPHRAECGWNETHALWHFQLSRQLLIERGAERPSGGGKFESNFRNVVKTVFRKRK